MNEEIIRGSSVKVAFIVGSIEGLVFLHTMPTTYKFQKYYPLGAIAKQPSLDERKHKELNMHRSTQYTRNFRKQQETFAIKNRTSPINYLAVYKVQDI